MQRKKHPVTLKNYSMLPTENAGLFPFRNLVLIVIIAIEHLYNATENQRRS